MTYFDQLDAPALAGCEVPLVKRHMFATFLGGRATPATPEIQRLFSGYLFAVDKSVREYRAGCENLIAYSSSANKTLILIEGLGRFETCVNSISRAFRFLRTLKKHRQSPALDRLLRRQIEALENSVSPIRNAIEHAESDVANPALMPAGAAHMLAVNHAGSALDISIHNITFHKLASIIETLVGAGDQLIDALPVLDATAANALALLEVELPDIG